MRDSAALDLEQAQRVHNLLRIWCGKLAGQHVGGRSIQYSRGSFRRVEAMFADTLSQGDDVLLARDVHRQVPASDQENSNHAQVTWAYVQVSSAYEDRNAREPVA